MARCASLAITVECVWSYVQVWLVVYMDVALQHVVEHVELVAANHRVVVVVRCSSRSLRVWSARAHRAATGALDAGPEVEEVALVAKRVLREHDVLHHVARVDTRT